MLRATFALVLSVLLLSACNMPHKLPAPANDADLAQLAREDAEAKIRDRDYPAAVEMLALAYRQTPKDLPLVLRYGELLEAVHQPGKAAGIYRQALVGVARDSEAIRELRYRLALASLYHLDDAATAEHQLQQLNRASHQALDLQACLILHDGRIDTAISQLDLALRLARNNDRKATVYYHLSLAYLQKDDKAQAIKELYEAINRAKNLGLVADITTLWEQIKPTN